MNIEKLENKIKELQEEIEKFKKEELKKLKKKENGRWRAKNMESYFFIEDTLGIGAMYDTGTNHVNLKYKYHNYFKTKEEAQAVADNIKTHIELMELAEELNTEHIDWENREQCKYYIMYNGSTKKITYDHYYYTKYANTVYCTNENFKEEAIKRIGEERLIKYLKGI